MSGGPQDEESNPAQVVAELLLDVQGHLAWLASAGDTELLRERTAQVLAPPRPALAATRTAAPPPAAAARPVAPPPAAPRPTAAPPPAARPAAAPAPVVVAANALPPGATEPAARLAEVRALLGDCRRCRLCEKRKSIVYGVGDPKAELVFVGEGPGEMEDLSGEPFVGPAGELLTKMIGAMGLSRERVYICNVVKCRPPGNRNPEPDEIAACQPFLHAQIDAIRPRAIVALGKFASQTLLQDATPITRMRGQWRTYRGIDLMPTFHPSYLLRSPQEKRKAWEDLQQVMAKLGLKRPV